MQTYGDHDYTEALYIDYDTSADEDNYYFNVIIGLEDFITLLDEDITVTWTCTSKNRMYGNQTITTTIPAGNRYVVYSWDDEQDEDIAYPFVDSLEITECDHTSFYGIKEAYLSYNKESFDDDNTGVYIGTDGIGLGAGVFYVDTKGFLQATNAYIEGDFKTTSLSAEIISSTKIVGGGINISENIITHEGTATSIIFAGADADSGVWVFANASWATELSGYYPRTATVLVELTTTSTDDEGTTTNVATTAVNDLSLTLTCPVKNTFTGKKSTRTTVVTFPAGESEYVFTITVSGTTCFDADNSPSVIVANTQSNYYYQDATTSGGVIQIDGNLLPAESGAYNLGSSAYPWITVYTQDDSGGSDRKIKDNIEDLSLELSESLVKNLVPRQFIFKNDKFKRPHYGFVAQEVEDEMESMGLTVFDNALIFKTDLNAPDSDTNFYGLNYRNLIAPLFKVVKNLLERIENLENLSNVFED